MPFDRSKFYLGANIGWLNEAYRHDFSYAFSDGWSPTPSSNTDFQDIVDAYLFHMNSRRMKVVRMWLFEQLEGMTFSGPTLTPPYASSATFAYRDWGAFTTRITTVMTSAQRYGLQIYWCLLDAAGLLSINTPPAWYRPLFAHMVNTVRANFKNDIVLPFLTAINPFQANVFAVDVANEIDWAWHGSGGMLPRADVANFVHEVYDFIKAHSTFDVTTGFASYAQMTTGTDFSFLDFYDYHRYFDPTAAATSPHGEPPTWTGSKACIIGEVGHEYSSGASMNETLQASSTRRVMDLALSRNYGGVLLWRYSPVGDSHRLLRLTTADHGISSTSTLADFLTRFRAVASGSSTGPHPFAEFERPVWNEVDSFAGTIPPARRP